MKAVLRGKLIALSECKKKLEKGYTTSLTALGQKEANIPKSSTRQEIIKLKVKIKQVETKRTIQKNQPIQRLVL